jgi:hypothetical protein
MASFPALPSGNNPYAAQAAGYASSAASVFNALNAAAQQHQARLDKQKQDDAAQARSDLQRAFENENALRKEGGILNPNTGSTHPGAPTLKRDDNPQPGDAAPAPQGPGQMVTEPVSGRQYYMPTASEKEQSALNDTNSFVPTGQLGAMLQNAGVKPGTRLKAADSHSILLALNEAQPKDEPYDIDSSGKFQDAQGNPTAVMIGRKTGTVKMLNFGGQQQPRPQSAQAGDQYAAPADGGAPGYDLSQIRGGQPGGAFALPDKPDKPDVSQIIPGQQGPNGGMLIYDKNSQTAKEIPLPKGSKAVMTAAQKEADADRHEREAERKDASKMKPAEARLIVKTKADALAKADAEYQKALTTAITPEDKKAAVAERQKGYQAAQNEYEESISAATGQQIPHNSWADTPASAPAQTSPGRGGPGGRGGQAAVTPSAAPATATAPAPTAQSPAKAATAPAITEGTIIRNRTTGARQILRGGQWRPL